MSDLQVAAVLFTIRLRSMAHFYERVVGMHVHRTEADHIVLKKGGFRLTVHQIPDEHARNISLAMPPKVRGSSAIKLSFPVESLSIARATAAQLGGCIYGTDHEWEYEETIVCDGWDPDGNVFQLFQAVA